MAINYLSDKELEKVDKFVKDKVQFEAVRKVLLDGIYNNGTLKKDAPADPLRNWALSLGATSNQGVHLTNEQVGAELRAMSEGIYFLEMALKQLTQISKKRDEEKAKVETKDGENPAL